MRLEMKAKIVTGSVYEKKDKTTGEKTGELGMMLNFLVDEKKDLPLSGNLIPGDNSLFVSKDYQGTYDLSEFKRLDNVLIDIEVPVGKKGSYILYNLKKI